VHSGERVSFDIALADVPASAAGRPTGITAGLETRRGRLDAKGEASTAAGGAFAGTVDFSTSSVLEFARWLGADVSAEGEPLKTSLSGKVTATTSVVRLTGTTIAVNATSGRLDGRLTLSGQRPHLAGTLTAERVDVARLVGAARRLKLQPEASDSDIAVPPPWERLLAEINALETKTGRIETGGTLLAPPVASNALAAAARPAWSEQPFNVSALGAMDLDLDMRLDTIAWGGLDARHGRIKARLADGLLEADIESVEVAGGKAEGAVKLDSRASPPRGAVALRMTNVAAEPIVSELAGRPLLAGTSTIEITVNAAGQNASELASSLDGKARLSMGAGAFRGFDIRAMISEWWRTWAFDSKRKTIFARLEAQYDIKRGVMTSAPDLALGGGEVEISSRGDVNVASKRLDQEIRIKIMAPPIALPVPAKISGAWSKPSIGIDWGGLLSSRGGLGAPQTIVAPSEPPPAAVQAAIRRVLAANVDPRRLSPEGKSMLRALLPAETSAEAARRRRPAGLAREKMSPTFPHLCPMRHGLRA
jgi:AsmA protein